MSASDCCTVDDLVRFRGGELSEASMKRIGEHLGKCAACARRNEDLDANHAEFFEKLRHVARQNVAIPVEAPECGTASEPTPHLPDETVAAPNPPGDAPPAHYPPGAVITLNNTSLYYENLINEGATINLIGVSALQLVTCCLLYGDIDPSFGDCDIDVDDILCSLGGFINPADCPQADIDPCGGNGLMDVDDILAMLTAITGFFACPHPCPP